MSYGRVSDPSRCMDMLTWAADGSRTTILTYSPTHAAIGVRCLSILIDLILQKKSLLLRE
ncbi:hypothetical protein SPRG_16224 [Saprolegnia parasitica CBS 223.65]|uniref:Uncharacterized protein n=1 Tax=Saprolegnia parasitica (strain CBS 223.65) TaxID=695850 RepID=A0A067BVT4_SAPPC|nr:hypothetical protein SPRG_16224 [Saprolegnia parasitica CBS 223.65]KDO18411.1 hypothetical protein SPRG_16224 [Saprolegnia parasitica CBS 223.65]|eukprot:XP_012210876.1 hypothetical protein SPRG_16224 [Saprolegnia parasitica CBS 223.65]